MLIPLFTCFCVLCNRSCCDCPHHLQEEVKTHYGARPNILSLNFDNLSKLDKAIKMDAEKLRKSKVGCVQPHMKGHHKHGRCCIPSFLAAPQTLFFSTAAPSIRCQSHTGKRCSLSQRCSTHIIPRQAMVCVCVVWCGPYILQLSCLVTRLLRQCRTYAANPAYLHAPDTPMSHVLWSLILSTR